MQLQTRALVSFFFAYLAAVQAAPLAAKRQVDTPSLPDVAPAIPSPALDVPLPIHSPAAPVLPEVTLPERRQVDAPSLPDDLLRVPSPIEEGFLPLESPAVPALPDTSLPEKRQVDALDVDAVPTVPSPAVPSIPDAPLGEVNRQVDAIPTPAVDDVPPVHSPVVPAVPETGLKLTRQFVPSFATDAVLVEVPTLKRQDLSINGTPAHDPTDPLPALPGTVRRQELPIGDIALDVADNAAEVGSTNGPVLQRPANVAHGVKLDVPHTAIAVDRRQVEVGEPVEDTSVPEVSAPIDIPSVELLNRQENGEEERNTLLKRQDVAGEAAALVPNLDQIL